MKKISDRAKELQDTAMAQVLQFARATSGDVSDAEWKEFVSSPEFKDAEPLLMTSANLVAVAMALDEWQATVESRLAALEIKCRTSGEQS